MVPQNIFLQDIYVCYTWKDFKKGTSHTYFSFFISDNIYYRFTVLLKLSKDVSLKTISQ